MAESVENANPHSGHRELTKKSVPPLAAIFSTEGNYFKHNPDIIRTNCLTKKMHRSLAAILTNVLNKFHEDWTQMTFRVLTRKCPPPGGHTINLTSRVFEKNARPPGGHVVQLTGTIFKLTYWDKSFDQANVYDGRRTADKRRYQRITMSM
ncbi:hypothetical protein DPMN_085854 [Dreissena polymorpha]|uniref:Uncharacterized protein n=1 Tax=Dreissena polymorpha TaxID=45954 RepID=A0A9D4BJS7_DREPO|nr:hypothetical protein DPMN_085854 [Dreissena polymorpha]